MTDEESESSGEDKAISEESLRAVGLTENQIALWQEDLFGLVPFLQVGPQPQRSGRTS